MSENSQTAIQESGVIDVTIASVLDKLESKTFTIYFYVPAMTTPSGGIGVLFKQAKILKQAGYGVKLLFEPVKDDRASYNKSMELKKMVTIYSKFQPTWLDFDISDLDLVPQLGMDEKGVPITNITYNDGTTSAVSQVVINPEDFIIIPEGFPNVMQQLAQIPCKKVVLAQSWIYILNSLQPGQTWQTFGINDCISISDGITEYINSIMPGMKIKQYQQSINRNIFNVPTNISDKMPMIGYSCSRGMENRMKTINVVRNFQQWYPQYKWIRFVELAGLSREEYAERLKSCSILLCTDEIAGFGTAPLEAMASGTHIVGWAPYGGKEYISKDNGFWANNGDIFQLSELLGLAVDKLLNGDLDRPDIQEHYEKVLSNYTQEKETNQVLQIYTEYINERINEIRQLQSK